MDLTSTSNPPPTCPPTAAIPPTAAVPPAAALPTVAASGPAVVSWDPEIAQWLAHQRNAGATPADIATALVGRGWDADAAASTARRSLRRADHHRVLYGALCWSAGLAALGLATGMHQALSGNPDPELTAIAFTFAVVLAPLAVFCGWSARRLESTSEHAIWSPTRRMWFGTLATCTAVVGLIRLVIYVYRVIATMTGATTAELTPEDQWQVVVPLLIAVPLFTWSFIEWRRSDVVISGLTERSAS